MEGVNGGGGAMPVQGARPPLVAVIDDGTKTVRVAVYKAESLEEVSAHEMDKSERQPREGWYEQDPREILGHARACAQRALQLLPERGYSKEDIVALGITNQRETTIAWDKVTGEPLYPAILWKDARAASTVDAVLARVPGRNKNHVKGACGLPVSAYFSAPKMRWLADNVRAVRRAARDQRLLFGTVDSWLVWLRQLIKMAATQNKNLTGGPDGGAHVTDVTNASRTLLMNLDTLNWDPMLCRLFGVARETLAQVRSSAEPLGRVRGFGALDGLPVCAVLGNQQAALLGQGCVRAGQAKSTLRSGAFLLYNTGARRVASTHGLLTTVAYKLGPRADTVYALEGSVAAAGGAVKFLRDNLRLIKDARETEQLAGQVFSTGDVYLVPAFSGLYAPYWRKDARGIICGLTAFTTKHHIVRAGLECICFQTRDILEAMNKDCGVPLSKLHVDGRATANGLLVQLQADLTGIPVLRASEQHMAARGAAIACALAAGLCALDDVSRRPPPATAFLPTTTQDDRDARYTKWKMAVQRSLGWAAARPPRAVTEERYRLLASVPAALFLLGSFAMLAAAAPAALAPAPR